MKQIKIKKEFWDAIVSGEKRFEFRKLSKGLVGGRYEFVSIETVTEANDEFESCDNCLNCAGNEICGKGNLPNEVYGTAHLTPLLVNPDIHVEYGEVDEDGFEAVPFIDSDDDEYEEPIHFESGLFITENYTKKRKENAKPIDYVAYKITEVKNG